MKSNVILQLKKGDEIKRIVDDAESLKAPDINAERLLGQNYTESSIPFLSYVYKLALVLEFDSIDGKWIYVQVKKTGEIGYVASDSVRYSYILFIPFIPIGLFIFIAWALKTLFIPWIWGKMLSFTLWMIIVCVISVLLLVGIIKGIFNAIRDAKCSGCGKFEYMVVDDQYSDYSTQREVSHQKQETRNRRGEVIATTDVAVGEDVTYKTTYTKYHCRFCGRTGTKSSTRRT